MPTLALYMTEFASGGVQRMNLNLAPRFMAAGFDVTFVVHEAKGALVDSVPPGVKVHSLDAPRARNAVRPLAAYLKAARPDIIVSSLGQPNLIALLANRIAGKPSKVIVSQRNHLTRQAREMPDWQYKVLPFLYRQFLHHADGIIAVSEGLADDLVVITGLPRERMTVIYNPAVPDDIDARAAEPVEHPWFTAKLPVVIAIGRMVAVKDYATMISAVARVPEAHLMILGEGPQLGELEAQVAQLGIAHRVAFLGFRDNPFAYLARASTFVLSSRHEGFGNVIAEALACGTPVVTTDCESGPAEIVDQGRYGRLVPVGDVAALAAALQDSLTETHDKAMLKARGQSFSVDRAADAYLSLFRKLLNHE
ncbi:MAG: glycosyltransferase [Sphingobium sp.]